MRPPRIEPGPGQESVWDYPRPPRTEPTSDLITVAYGELAIAETTSAIRVLETSQPPAYYIPREDIDFAHLLATPGRSYCEWKGEASYYSLNVPSGVVEQVAWSYAQPNEAFEVITGYVAFYAQKMDCTIAGEAVSANDGTFYGGWITSKVVGPFKGGPGSAWW